MDDDAMERKARSDEAVFDAWCKRSYAPGTSPPFIGDAMQSVARTLHGAWLLAVKEFGDKAQPVHAVMLLSAIESERVRLESISHRRAQDESGE